MRQAAPLVKVETSAGGILIDADGRVGSLADSQSIETTKSGNTCCYDALDGA